MPTPPSWLRGSPNLEAFFVSPPSRSCEHRPMATSAMTSDRLWLRAAAVGPCAAGALGSGALGRVRAVFAHSFYVSLDAGWVAIVDAGLGPGPLNVVCEPWPRGLALGAM